jgi:hypothetical protein
MIWNNQKALWINLCLVNLSVVALFGLLLRSKIVFSIPFLDYTHLLNAHSHFALAGWAGLGLITLLIYELLPQQAAQRPVYQWLLASLEVSALGMAVTFSFMGYATASNTFLLLHLATTFVFAIFFIKDLVRAHGEKTVRLLGITAISSLLVSAIGTLGLIYILVSKTLDAVLYRDALYLFLHFQYNGFFTLAVFALFINHARNKGIVLTREARRFALLLCLSVLPALFLSLLWHGNAVFYSIAAVGCILILISLFYFIAWLRQLKTTALFEEPISRTLWTLAAFSFGLKMLLNVGTIFPQLGRAVYGDRPVIIGFLHLVFLGFLTFFLLAMLVEYGYFKKSSGTVRYPFVVFGFGIIANELLLALQGLGNLLRTPTAAFNWLLWGGSILLFAGALLLLIARLRSSQRSAHQTT